MTKCPTPNDKCQNPNINLKYTCRVDRQVRLDIAFDNGQD